MSEVRHALRRLLQRPGPTAACVFALALAIGAVATMAGIVSRILIEPLPVDKPDRLVTFHTRSDFGLSDGFPYEALLRIRESYDTFTGVTGIAMQAVALTSHGVTRDVQALFVTPDYFRLLGVRLPVGRDFTPADNRPGAPLAAILSYRFWNNTFEQGSEAIGTAIRVSDVPATIIGVAPRGFSGTRLAISEARDNLATARRRGLGGWHNYCA
ncbi:MAG: hypothetical protein GEV06_15300 [Luteitalea sp.]|nr:hypothetical protein [Luteitalea sp.]